MAWASAWVQTIEVLAQGFAGQKDGRNAQVAVLYLGGNEVLLSFVQLGLGDVSDRRLVEATVCPRGISLCDTDFRRCRIFRGNTKCDLVPHRDLTSEKARQEDLAVVREYAESRVVSPLDARYSLAKSRCGFANGYRSHTLWRILGRF